MDPDIRQGNLQFCRVLRCSQRKTNQAGVVKLLGRVLWIPGWDGAQEKQIKLSLSGKVAAFDESLWHGLGTAPYS